MDRLGFQGRVTNGGNCAFLPGVANEEEVAETMMEVDESYRRKQADQFPRQLAYHPVLSYGRDPCYGELEVVGHGHVGQAMDSAATDDPVHHRLACHPLFALLPQFDS